jgi:competence protein ComEC
MSVGKELGAWPLPLAAVSLPHQPCVAGQSWVWDGVRFRVLFPVPGLVLKGDNNQSCVLAIEGAGQSALLPGDLERPGEDALLAEAPEALRAGLLVLGHHGSASSSSADFLAAVAPQEALVSAGYRNRFHHPSVKTLARLDEVHIPYRSTVTDGTLVYVMAAAAGRLPEPLAWRRAAHRYWLTTP